MADCNKDLVDFLRSASKNNTLSNMFEKEAEILLLSHFPLLNEEIVKNFLKSFKKKWTSVARSEEKLSKKHFDWLQKEIFVPCVSTRTPTEMRELGTGGRPTVQFELGSQRTKKRKSDELRSNRSSSELLYAAMRQLREEGRPKDANIVQKLIDADCDGCIDLKDEAVYTPDEALALLLDCRLSKEDYHSLRSGAVAKGSQLYPSYHLVLEAKERCLPTADSSESVSVSDYSAEVKLQALLNHTVNRIITSSRIQYPIQSTILLISKVGFDGSTGQSVYKQITSDDSAPQDVAVEESLFLTCLVPLQIVIKDTKEVLWTNERPSSTYFCRPVRFRYVKENATVLEEELKFIKLSHSQLTPTVLTGETTVEHHLEITMVDGKVQTILSDKTNSPQCCSICGLNPSKMNCIEDAVKISTDLQPISFQFSISILHMWIRCMECLLHIAYRLDFKTWQARGPEKQAFVKTRKLTLQRQLREKLGIIVDLPKSGGSGTTNDGNTSRRFFQNSETVSHVLGINEELTRRLYVILCTLSSLREINADRLEQFCAETARLYVLEYPWYPMPQAVHKLLLHSHQVVRVKELPVGMLSEEAQEASNKNFKNFREFFTRKSSRKKTNEDLMRRLLCTSDPLISQMRRSLQKPKPESELPAECESLFC